MVQPTDARPVKYGNVTLRSHLEADWALTLDGLGIRWEYEPETIAMPSGAIYMPDFWLPELGTWIEVKGDGVPRVEKAVELGETRACHCDGTCSCAWPGGELVLIGHPPQDCTNRTHRAWRRGGHLNWSTSTGRTAWLHRCENCQRAGWIAAVMPLQCRACRERPTGHLYGPADAALRFAGRECLPPGGAQ
jgi:hypothetical protein